MSYQSSGNGIIKKFYIHLLFICAMMGFALCGLLMFPPDGAHGTFFSRTNYFWVRLIWFELILMILWHACAGSHLMKILSKRWMTGGVFAIIGASYFSLTFYSFIIWIVGCFLPASLPWQMLPLVAQFILILFYAWLLYFLPCTQELQTSDMQAIPLILKMPEDLANAIFTLESTSGLSEESKKALQRIREKIKYSLPRCGKISTSENYKLLVDETEEFLKLSNGDILDRMSSFEEVAIKRILSIIHECKR